MQQKQDWKNNSRNSFINNKEFLEKMLAAETPEALVQVYSDNDVFLQEVSPQEAFDTVQRIKSGELTEDELEIVNDGASLALSIGSISLKVIGFTSGAAAGIAIAGIVAVAAVACYAIYKTSKTKKRR